MRDILGFAGEKVIDPDDLMPLGKEQIRQVGTQKASGTGNQNTHASKSSMAAAETIPACSDENITRKNVNH
jgi:hypothetical protein